MGSLALAVGMVIFCVFGFRAATADRRKQRKALAGIQLWPIADVPHDTLARVKGTARAISETRTAPLTGRPCFYYIVTVSSYSLGGGGRGTWSPVVSDRAGCVFGVADTSGVAIVDPSIAQVELTQDHVDASDMFNKTTERQHAFLTQHGLSGKRSDNLQFVESIIAVDEPIVVRGYALREPDTDAMATDAYRGATPTRVRFLSSAKYPIEITDDKKAVNDARG
jgi:hypothetical protein